MPGETLVQAWLILAPGGIPVLRQTPVLPQTPAPQLIPALPQTLVQALTPAQRQILAPVLTPVLPATKGFKPKHFAESADAVYLVPSGVVPKPSRISDPS